jgi:hypothetical protein
MAKIQKCEIAHCPFIVCQKCYHWYDSNKLKEHREVCRERPPPTRKLLPYDPGCRRGFSYHRDKSYAEIDASIENHLKLGDRLVYVKEHKKSPVRRKQREVIGRRSTNASPATKET